jgi:hypothetical protein
MITWESRTHCITEWHLPTWPYPLRFIGWGCEVGNGFGFFAHERLGGIGCQINSSRLESNSPKKVGSTWSLDLPKAPLYLQTEDELIACNRIVRQLSVFNPAKQRVAWIGDAVLRLVVPWEKGLVAEMEQKDIVHSNTNFYYDTEEPAVALRWPDGRRLVVGWLQPPQVPPALTPYLYVRDQPAMPQSGHAHCSEPAWVIHARLLVDYPAALVFRVWRNPLVLWSRGLLGRYLLSSRYLKNLWRAGEWNPGTRWNLFGLWPLLPAQSLNFGIKLEAFP